MTFRDQVIIQLLPVLLTGEKMAKASHIQRSELGCQIMDTHRFWFTASIYPLTSQYGDGIYFTASSRYRHVIQAWHIRVPCPSCHWDGFMLQLETVSLDVSFAGSFGERDLLYSSLGGYRLVICHHVSIWSLRIKWTCSRAERLSSGGIFWTPGSNHTWS